MTKLTPGKKPLELPTQALTDAIDAEWSGQKKFSTQKMPLTTLAYTAIDKMAGQVDMIYEILLAYIDTDTLCYRAYVPDIAERQKKGWDPVIAWASKEFGEQWQVTSGIMPLEQPEALQANVKKYFATLSDMQLAAACVLASLYSSLVLTLAVLKKYLNAEQAFDLSRLEEDAQAEHWGKVDEALARRSRMKEEISQAGQFLRLLEVK